MLEDVAPAPQGSKVLEEAVDGHARRPGERAPELRAERDRSRRVTVRDYVRTRRRRAGPAPASREPPPRTRPRRRADEARAHAGPKASGALAGRARRGEADGPTATRGDLDREAVGERVLEHVVPELSAVRQRHSRGGGARGYAVDARRRRLRPDAGVRAVVGAGQRRAAAVQRRVTVAAPRRPVPGVARRAAGGPVVAPRRELPAGHAAGPQARRRIGPRCGQRRRRGQQPQEAGRGAPSHRRAPRRSPIGRWPAAAGDTYSAALYFLGCPPLHAA